MLTGLQPAPPSPPSPPSLQLHQQQPILRLAAGSPGPSISPGRDSLPAPPPPAHPSSTPVTGDEGKDGMTALCAQEQGQEWEIRQLREERERVGGARTLSQAELNEAGFQLVQERTVGSGACEGKVAHLVCTEARVREICRSCSE